MFKVIRGMVSQVVENKRFGRSGHEVSRFGFGAWGIGGGMWQGTSDRVSIVALESYLRGGGNFIDTAFVYGRGHSESLIGEVLPRIGGAVFIASKIPPATGQWPMPDGVPFERAFPRDHIWRCTEQSLERLKRNELELQQFHVWSDTWANQDEWKRVVDDLRSQRLVKNFGVSVNEYQPTNVIETVRTGFIDSVQVIFNLFEQSPKDTLFPLCVEKQISVIAREPLDTGFLAGAVTPDTEFPANDWRLRKFSKEYFTQALPKMEVILGLSAEAELSTAEVALRFAAYHPAVTVVIPGMRRDRHVEENRLALAQGPLPTEILAKLGSCRWESRKG